MTLVGLRVDVDTFRGTRLGVPELCRLLAKHDLRASFFFSVGPDNMGRHLWRLARPAFLLKMLRTRAASLYGWDILLRGTLWQGPVIGRRLGQVIHACAEAGHEIGLHAWDHHAWQSRVERLDGAAVRTITRRGLDMLTEIGAPATCSAAPAWRCTDTVLEEKASFEQLAYNSDCRGEGVFTPVVNGRRLLQPQVPVNLPTYDEVIGSDDFTEDSYNDRLLDQIQPDGYNVLCIHAEVEGIATATMFEEFLARCVEKRVTLVPLSALVPTDTVLPEGRLVRRTVPGREGWLSWRG